MVTPATGRRKDALSCRTELILLSPGRKDYAAWLSRTGRQSGMKNAPGPRFHWRHLEEWALNKRFRCLTSAVLVFLLALSGIAAAHTAPWDDGVRDSAKEVHGRKNALHGGTGGHLPGENNNIEVLSSLKLRNVVPEKIADVAVLKKYAYVAAWGVETCKYNGVHVVNTADLRKPREVAFIQAKEGSYPGEGVQAVTISTPYFNGDLLITNNEKCRETAGFGGINLYDVSKPKAPTPLYEGFGDDAVNGTGKKDAHETHSAFAWDAGDKAYAAIVDNEEARDLDIIDITNPKKPKLVKEYDLVADFPDARGPDDSVAQEGMPENFLHDMVVRKFDDRYVMLLGYWDAGYVQLDVTNPAGATYISDSEYAAVDEQAADSGLTVPPEGNGHQAEWTKNGDYVIGADEDFDPYKLSATDNEGEPFAGTIGIPFEPGSTLPNDLVYVGQACSGVPAGTEDQLALVERGTCFFTDKQTNVEAAGYGGMIVFNNEDGSTPVCEGLINMLVEGDKPSFFVGRQTAFDFINAPYDNTLCTDGDTATQSFPAIVGQEFLNAVDISSYFDGWGYVRLFDAATMNQLDTYAVPEAHDPDHASGSGDVSVHEVATSKKQNSLAYYAYYSAGVRVTRIVGDQLVEVGSFVDEGGSNIWGIEAFKRDGVEYIAASDRDLGLYILKYTGNQ